MGKKSTKQKTPQKAAPAPATQAKASTVAATAAATTTAKTATVTTKKNASKRRQLEAADQSKEDSQSDDEVQQPEPKRAKQSQSSSSNVPMMLISVGTYERNLYGVSAKWTAESSSSKDEEPQRLSLEPEYIFPAHAGCIKAMATGGRFLASGSTDELIHLYDTRRRKELGTLAQHSGTITSLVFHGTVNMLSASDDGEICVWRSKDWECLATLKGHKGSVNAVTIHPSGKLALSVGVDKSLRVWNLETGKQASTSRLRQEGIAVVWSAESETTPKQYAVLMDRAVEVYDVNTASLAARIEPAKGLTRLHCLCAAAVPSEDGKSDSAQSILLVGSEDKMLRVYDARDGKELSATKVHDSRLKGIAVSSIPLPPSSDSKQGASRKTMQVVTTISSDGFIKIWDLHHLLKSSADTVQPIGAYDTKKSRLTAVAVTTAH